MYFLNNARIIQSICDILLLLVLVKKIIFLFYGHTLFPSKNSIIKLSLFVILYYWLQMTASKDQIISKDDFLYPKRLYHINVLTNSSTLGMLKMKWLKLTSEVNTEVKSKPKQEKSEKRITFIWMYELWSFAPKKRKYQFCSHSVSSVTQSCPTLCDSMDCSTPGLPVHHQLPELAQTHVHQVSDAIHLSHSLSSTSPAFNLSQHQGLFQSVSSSHQVAKVLEFQLQHQSCQWIFRTISFRMDCLDLLAV